MQCMMMTGGLCTDASKITPNQPLGRGLGGGRHAGGDENARSSFRAARKCRIFPFNLGLSGAYRMKSKSNGKFQLINLINENIRWITLSLVTVCALVATGCASGPNFTNGQTTRDQMRAVLGQPLETFSFDDGITRVRWGRTFFHGVSSNGDRFDTALTLYDGEFGPDGVLRRWRAVDQNVSLRVASGFDLQPSMWSSGYLQVKPEFPRGSLLEACAGGSPQEVEAAIRAGADVNKADDHGQTPLMAAAHENEDGKVIAMLVNHGANVNARSVNSSTPLTIAAQNNERVIPALIVAGASVNAQNNSGKTPLWLATWSHYTSGVAALIKAGANPNLKDKQGRAPLAVAAVTDNVDAVPLLVHGGANVNANDGMGTALQLAIINKRSAAVIAALLKAGASVDVRNSAGKSVLEIARENGSVDIVKLLVDAGAK